jgi:histidinol-phosphatase
MGKYDDDLRFAHELADEADKISSKWFRAAELKTKEKADQTPVTIADTAIEQMCRERITSTHPTDQILGEEFGGSMSDGRLWIIDPIDGTKNFAHGNPVYGTLIALVENSKLVVAVVSAPQLKKRWYATLDGGAWSEGKRLEVSKIDNVNQAYFAYGNMDWWKKMGKDDEFWQLYNTCQRQRGFGDFWIYMLVAEGGADVAAEPGGLKLWDIAAPKLIVEEAGGKFTNLRGTNEVDGSTLATNGLLHKQALSLVV